MTQMTFPFSRFLDEYTKHNITFWVLMVENKPSVRLIKNYHFSTWASWPSSSTRSSQDLGPMLANSSHSNVQFIILDDNQLYLLFWAKVVGAEMDIELSVDVLSPPVPWGYLGKFLP